LPQIGPKINIATALEEIIRPYKKSLAPRDFARAGNKGITMENPNTSIMMLRTSVNIAREGFI
jgi:hypothetical protein